MERAHVPLNRLLPEVEATVEDFRNTMKVARLWRGLLSLMLGVLLLYAALVAGIFDHMDFNSRCITFVGLSLCSSALFFLFLPDWTGFDRQRSQGFASSPIVYINGEPESLAKLRRLSFRATSEEGLQWCFGWPPYDPQWVYVERVEPMKTPSPEDEAPAGYAGYMDLTINDVGRETVYRWWVVDSTEAKALWLLFRAGGVEMEA